MRKKILFFISVLLTGILAMTDITTVKAEQYIGEAIWPSEYISNVYIKKVRSDGYAKYQQGQFIRRSEDNAFVYCLQPFVTIDNNYIYNIAREDYEVYLNMTKEQWNRISLLAYYGYGYGNHNSQKWYAITQVLIWRTAEPNSDIYFTNTLNGTRNDSLFASEIQEIENLVANKVKATITSLKQLIINDESWTEIVEDGLYKYEKIYSESVTELVSYEDLEGNTGTIEVKIDIELNDLFVTYQEDPDTQNVTAYVTTEEEVLEVPEGWTIDTEYQEGYRYYKVYTENVDYELVEFVTDSKYYVATIIIDSIDRDAPVATSSVTYITEEEEKKQVVITVSANEVINGIDGWSLSEDKKTLVKIIDKPTVDIPTDELNESITIMDLKGNETIISYTYNWN